MTPAKPNIERIWSRIEGLAGETFETKTGMTFTYRVTGATLRPSRANQAIGRSDFVKALELAPLEGPGEIRDVVRGSAYVWAILHDRRVREGDW